MTQEGARCVATESLPVYDPVCGGGKYILTPPAPSRPIINGPSIYGVRPGAPFLYKIPVTGNRPMRLSAENLPEGLNLDEVDGVISGTIADLKTVDYPVLLVAENEAGCAEKRFTIKVGKTICLTPPLGWNSWNCWRTRVTQQHVLDSARAMVETGLINYGWSYINIDDAWQGRRGGVHNAIQPDPERFPDLGKLCADVHALGLKIGIYSSPWMSTYAGRIGGSSDSPGGDWERDLGPDDIVEKRARFRIGKYCFEQEDARQWAEWGFDYLKYDWKPNDRISTQRMADALKACGRDMVFSLSNSAPVEHADLFETEVSCWRTAGDLKDLWDGECYHFNLIEQWTAHRRWLETGARGGPGHFPDADMLVVGNLTTAEGCKGEPVPSRLGADEQYAHISLWALWSCPLLIGCPIEMMDDFTLGLLTNSEVLAINQDERGIPGYSIDLADDIEVVVKELADGSRAFGMFNKGTVKQTVSIDWKAVGLNGPQRFRDVWRQKDIGTFDHHFSAAVRPHGVVLIRSVS
ncbi:putative Ig domain-containing protein [Pontiella agarivorans]|nr:putative Ig domain-containing protein [Pontiella agarivorans]